MKPLLKVLNVTKSYGIGEDAYTALRGVNLSIDNGEFVAIMGPSGSGKSTLMHILGALDSPDSGRYFINDIDISSLNDDELAEIRNRKIGFVFQSFNLLPRTSVIKNVERPLMYAGIHQKERNRRAHDALKLVKIEHKASNLSNQISGGQVQRVAIARALVTNPAILLADEPTGNLDTKTSYEIMSHLQSLNDSGRTIVLITHEKDIALFAKRIVTLRDGKITSDHLNKQERIEVK